MVGENSLFFKMSGFMKENLLMGVFMDTGKFFSEINWFLKVSSKIIFLRVFWIQNISK